MKKIPVSSTILAALIFVVGFINHVYHKQLIAKNTDIKNNFESKLLNIALEHQKQINQLKAGISQDNIRRWNILNTEKVIETVNKNIPHTIRMDYAEWIVNETDKYEKVSPAIILGLMAQESRFNDSAVSYVGAKGLGQIMPLTGQDICEHLKISYVNGIEFNAKMNIKMTVWYLNRLIQHYNNIEQALAHYNGGYRQAYRYSLVHRKNLSDDEKYQLSRLAEETRDYVPKVLSNFKRFEEMMTLE